MGAIIVMKTEVLACSDAKNLWLFFILLSLSRFYSSVIPAHDDIVASFQQHKSSRITMVIGLVVDTVFSLLLAPMVILPGLAYFGLVMPTVIALTLSLLSSRYARRWEARFRFYQIVRMVPLLVILIYFLSRTPMNELSAPSNPDPSEWTFGQIVPLGIAALEFTRTFWQLARKMFRSAQQWAKDNPDARAAQIVDNLKVSGISSSARRLHEKLALRTNSLLQKLTRLSWMDLLKIWEWASQRVRSVRWRSFRQPRRPSPTPFGHYVPDVQIAVAPPAHIVIDVDIAHRP
ncbi:hypothetical protein CC2G_008276 [Coprinopsis cinerea AmutBmut pab1-1]|nr:hypothetical protein CC2G_008276 [Coprinopsis cinerea AmutBmut pab1-1]